LNHLLKITIGFLVLSGTGAVMADEAMLQTTPAATAAVSAETCTGLINARGDVNEGSAGVNETDPIEVNKAGLHDSDVSIELARQDVIRDTGKLSDDKIKLEDAQTTKNDPAAAKAKTEVESDQVAVSQDRERLKRHLENKIGNDKILVSLLDEKIKDDREEAARHNHKMSDDTAKLDDARKRYVADEIEQRKTVVENDQTDVDADTQKLNLRVADKAEYVMELQTDSRHLNEVVHHLSEEDPSPLDNKVAENK
jgi:hypothetical protein